MVELELRVENVSGIIANIYRGRDGALAGIRDAVHHWGDQVRFRARQRVRIRSGRTHDAITTEYGDAGLSFTTFVDPEPFEQAGLSYYPLWLEIGTRTMPASPYFFPSFREVEPLLIADIGARIRRGFDAVAV